MDALTYATLQVVIDGQAYMHALITLGGDAPEDEFQAAMTAFKEETGELINQVLESIRQEIVAEEAAEAEATQEEE